MVSKRLIIVSFILVSILATALVISAAGSSNDTNSPNDTDPARTIGRTGNDSNNATCGNNICETGEDPADCPPCQSPSEGCPNALCLRTCPQDCDNETEDGCEWSCTKWTDCVNGTATRTCTNVNNCTTEKPRERKNCMMWERCDTLTNRTERIKCRLENANRFENFSESDESCLGLRNRGLCVALYVRSQNCYKMEGERKDRCFRMVANFTQAQLNKEVNASQNKTHSREKVRHYMILVLYNLQERVEKAVERGNLTEDEGAAIINKIVEIKKIILEGATKSEIRVSLQELKEMWRTYKADGE